MVTKKFLHLTQMPRTTEEYRNIIPVGLIASGTKNRKFSLSQQNCCSAHQTKFQPKLWIRGALGVIFRPSRALSAYRARIGRPAYALYRRYIVTIRDDKVHFLNIVHPPLRARRRICA